MRERERLRIERAKKYLLQSGCEILENPDYGDDILLEYEAKGYKGVTYISSGKGFGLLVLRKNLNFTKSDYRWINQIMG